MRYFLQKILPAAVHEMGTADLRIGFDELSTNYST
jgi:hypothetical protein